MQIYAENKRYFYDLKGNPLDIEYLPYYSGNVHEVGFSDGLCAVYVGSMCSYVKKDGKLAFPDKIFRDGGAFSEGLAYVRDTKSHSYGYIDRTGAYVIPPIYGEALSFSEGLAPVYSLIKEKWGYIDHNGNVIIDFKFNRAYPFKDGYAFVAGEKIGFINYQGKYCMLLDLLDIYPETFGIREGFFPYKKSDRSERGYMDIAGRKKSFDKDINRCLDFEEGLAAVQYNNGISTLWGFIDKNGCYVIEPKYIDVSNFSGGYAWGCYFSDLENKYVSVIFDNKGDVVTSKINIDVENYRAVITEGILVVYHKS